MAKDLKNINIARAAAKLPLLDKLPEEDNANDNADKGKADDPPLQDPPPPGTKTDPAPAEVEYDDAQVIKALEKKGIKVASIDDLLPKPDPVLAAEKREVEKLSYSLSKGLYTLKDHENFVREKDNPRDLVFADYYEEAKKEDPELSAEQIQAEFEEKYGINEEPNSRKFKRGVQEIGLLADKLLKSKYKKIFDADGQFTSYESTESTKQTRSRTILSKAPLYKRDVETVFEGLKKIKIDVSPTESYEVDVPEEAWTAAKEMFLDPATAESQIASGYNAETLKDIAYTTLVRENFQTLFLEGAKQYHLKRQSGSKGIPPVGPQSRSPRRDLTEDQRKVLSDNGIKEEDLPPVTSN